MPTLSILAELPGGYFVEETPRGILAVHADVTRALHEAGYSPEADGELRPSELAGRAPLHELELLGECYLVRRFRHGGLLRRFTGSRFLDPERPFRELILSDSLTRLGIPTPRVVAARARNLGFGWELDLVTRRIEGTLDLGHWLDCLRRGEVSERSRRGVLEAVGDLVRRLHLHGCLHADLQPHNILVRPLPSGGQVELWLLDLDRSYFVDAPAASQRRAQLERFYRHVARSERRRGPALRLTDWARFLRGYDPERARWKADWRAVRSRYALGWGLHRAGGLIDRLLGGRSEESQQRGLLQPGRRS